jgi:large subunit ribosomal protein L6
MSRVGKLPIPVPSGVDVDLSPMEIVVKGVKGVLSMELTKDVVVTKEGDTVVVKPVDDSRRARSMWGTVRNRIDNMVKGVANGCVKSLEIRGVGYRAALSGNLLTLSLGYSHEIKFVVPKDISVKVDKQTLIEISGIDNQKVGQIAAEIRALRKPEPYKGKGVRYAGEYVRIKEGKKK